MRAIGIVSLMLLIVSCNGESTPTGTDGPVPTTQVYKSKSSGIAGRRGEVISRQSRWAEVWDEITAGQSPKPALPAVNFEESILIFGAVGGLPDGCYDGRIESVQRRSGALEISIVEERHTGCAVCPQLAVNPVHVVSVPRLATGATFTFRTATINSCP